MNNVILKNIFKTVGSAGASQAMPLLFIPLLARLYDPVSFSKYALFVAITTFISIFSTMRLEHGIITQSTNRKVYSYTIALIYFTIIGSCFIFIVLFLIKLIGFDLFKLLCDGVGYLTLLFGVLFFSIFSILNLTLTRHAHYNVLSISRIIRSFMEIIISILFGYIGNYTNGMIYGIIIGYLSGIIYILYFYSNIKYNKILFLNHNFKVLIKDLSLPKFDLPSALLNNLSNYMPIYFLGFFYDDKVVGYYSLANRSLSAPIGLATNSIGLVFRENASRLYRENGEFHSFYKKTFFYLFLISLPGFIVIGLFGKVIFSFIFGAQWIESGMIASLLAPYFLFKFASTPLAYSFYITNELKKNLIWQIVLNFIAIVAFSFYFVGMNYTFCIFMYSIFYTIMYIIYLRYMYIMSKGK